MKNQESDFWRWHPLISNDAEAPSDPAPAKEAVDLGAKIFKDGTSTKQAISLGAKTFEDGDIDGALAAFKGALSLPGCGKAEERAIYYNMARCFVALAGQSDKKDAEVYNGQAFLALDASVKAGFNDWAKLRDDASFKFLRESASTPWNKFMTHHDENGMEANLAYLNDEVKGKARDPSPGEIAPQFFEIFSGNWLGGGYRNDELANRRVA